MQVMSAGETSCYGKDTGVLISPTYFLVYFVWWWEYFVWC